MRLSGSIVLFNNPREQFELAISSFFGSMPTATLVVIDNSPKPLNSHFFSDRRVLYKHLTENVGFGAGHNIAFNMRPDTAEVHLFLNPDVEFVKSTLPELLRNFERIPDLGALNPRIRYPDGKIQRLSKLIPTPIDLFVRRFLPIKRLRSFFEQRYELRWLDEHTTLIDVPIISGCFLLVNADIFRRVGGFDERYFMYLEDYDLVRKIRKIGRIMLDPAVYIVHAYAKGSYSNPVLRKYHLKSAIRYFNKWGWIWDRERAVINGRMLKELHHYERSKIGTKV